MRRRFDSSDSEQSRISSEESDSRRDDSRSYEKESKSSESESSEEDVRVLMSTFPPASTTNPPSAGRTTTPSTTPQGITECVIVDVIIGGRGDNDNVNTITCCATG